LNDSNSQFWQIQSLGADRAGIASFGIGTTEFVIMGLLPDVAHDLSITIPRAGLLISGYALGVVFGAPILAIGTARLERRHRRGSLVLAQVDSLAAGYLPA
jgi:predicted MFS family arabinose efflux permease